MGDAGGFNRAWTCAARVIPRLSGERGSFGFFVFSSNKTHKKRKQANDRSQRGLPRGFAKSECEWCNGGGSGRAGISGDVDGIRKGWVAGLGALSMLNTIQPACECNLRWVMGQQR
jgi:hypothetical protein